MGDPAVALRWEPYLMGYLKRRSPTKPAPPSERLEQRKRWHARRDEDDALAKTFKLDNRKRNGK